MVTTAAPHHAHHAAERDAHQRHLDACARALEAPRWRQRLSPFAETLVSLRLVRGRNEHGAPVRRLDAEMLRETMCRLLRAGDENAYLVFELVVEAMDPQWLAAERGTSVHVLTEQLREAVQWVASAYEARAYAGAVAEPGLAGFIRSRQRRARLASPSGVPKDSSGMRWYTDVGKSLSIAGA
jgi:hypothetical protein